MDCFRSHYPDQLPTGTHDNSRAPGSDHELIKMRRCHGRGCRGFSPGPPEGTQSFNNYTEILLFAPARVCVCAACVCLWVCASVRKQAWTLFSRLGADACRVPARIKTHLLSWAPGTDARVRPPQHIDPRLSQRIDSTSRRHF